MGGIGPGPAGAARPGAARSPGGECPGPANRYPAILAHVNNSRFRLGWAVVAVALCAVVAGVGLVGAARADAAPAPKVVVSLTFDDGFETVWGVRPQLRKYEMHATFFINSGKLNQTGRLTSSQVRQLAADGNEIGGHSVSHPNIANLDPLEAKRQICDDRVALAGLLGTAPTDFAYPYGAYTPATQAIVAGCGYNSARRVGGVASASCLPACPYAESMPPADRVCDPHRRLRRAIDRSHGPRERGGRRAPARRRLAGVRVPRLLRRLLGHRRQSRQPRASAGMAPVDARQGRRGRDGAPGGRRPDPAARRRAAPADWHRAGQSLARDPRLRPGRPGR